MVAVSIAPPDPFGIDEALVNVLESGKLVVPPFPSVALELQRRVQADDYSAADLARIVQADQALSATLLRMANLESVNKVTTVGAAIARLGVKSLVSLAVSAQFSEDSNKQGPLVTLRRTLWRESVVAGILARDLGPDYGIEPEEAFLCGLLHDVGRLVAVVSAEKVSKKRSDLEALPADIWLMHIDRHHVRFGTVVAERWELPSPLLQAVRDHHDVDGMLPPAGSDAGYAAAALMAHVDGLVDLLNRNPFVTEQDLHGLDGLDGPRSERVAELLTKLPAAAAAVLGEMTSSKKASGKKKAKAPVSLVKPEPADLGAGTKAIELPFRLKRSSAEVAFRLTAIAHQAMRIEGPEALAVGFLAQGTIDADTGASPIDLFLTVQRSETIGKVAVVDLKPFSLSDAKRQAWSALVHG